MSDEPCEYLSCAETHQRIAGGKSYKIGHWDAVWWSDVVSVKINRNDTFLRHLLAGGRFLGIDRFSLTYYFRDKLPVLN